MGGDYMRGGGTHSPHRNPNAYPMTDERRRHWLDVARFGESSGKEANIPFPHAWRYRELDESHRGACSASQAEGYRSRLTSRVDERAR